MSSNIKNINYDDFKNICRVCMFDCGTKFYLDHVISNIYHKLTDLRVETNDDLPKQICGKCIDKMSEIQEFIFQCVRTHDALMECLKQKQLNEAGELQNEEQDVTVNAKRNRNSGELVMSFQKRVKVEERNSHKIEIDQNTELDEGIIPEAREIKEEVIENIDLPKTSYNLTEEITIEDHKIGLVKDEHVFDKANEIDAEQNIKSDDDLFAPNTSNINSESDEYSDYNNTSSDDSDSESNNENSDVLTNKKEAKQNKTSESNDCKRSYKCTKCPKAFTRSDRLKVHMRKHTGEHPYKCDQCSRLFSRLDHMKAHLRTHTGERPFKCDHCSKSYIYSSDLKSHMAVHTGERPYKCAQCSKTFIQSSCLKIHLRTHTGERPYKCNQCTKSFAYSTVLTRHMRTHTGERPHKCEHCSKSFAQSHVLRDHMRIHTGERPYKCEQCSKMFTQSSNLNTHMRTYHNSA